MQSSRTPWVGCNIHLVSPPHVLLPPLLALPLPSPIQPPPLTTSLTTRRSGTPHWPSVSSHQTAPDWSANVSWQKGDILDPASYIHHLEGADAVIHSMGILLEADYKGVVSGRESPIKGLQRAFSTKKAGTQDPLHRREGERLAPQESDGQLTYEVMNRDTGQSVSLHTRLLLLTNCSRLPCARSIAEKSPRLPLHLRRRRHPYSACPLHHNQARGRVHHKHHIPLDALHLHPRPLSLRRLAHLHPTHRCGRWYCVHGEQCRGRASDVVDGCWGYQAVEGRSRGCCSCRGARRRRGSRARRGAGD